LDAPLLPTSTAPADPAPAARNETETVPTDNSLPTQVAALGPTGQTKSVKADYGWLSDLMAKWIGELDKRYPAILRTEGVTGRVTLTALLHQNGTLTNVRVVKSSGNALLDQVAIEDITNGPPVKLSRPLDRPNMPVKFSIVYDLKNAR
jgi:protein TonB